MDFVGRQRKHHLAGTAQRAKPLEDQPDRFLQAHVRIQPQADLPMPDVAERHADAQFTAMRLGTSGFEHPCPDQAEFELADAALHSQQQPVVGPTGVVYAVRVNDPCLDQTTQLQQVVPVTPIAGKPRGVQA